MRPGDFVEKLLSLWPVEKKLDDLIILLPFPNINYVNMNNYFSRIMISGVNIHVKVFICIGKMMGFRLISSSCPEML